jgi:hypothetical protein
MQRRHQIFAFAFCEVLHKTVDDKEQNLTRHSRKFKILEFYLYLKTPLFTAPVTRGCLWQKEQQFPHL